MAENGSFMDKPNVLVLGGKIAFFYFYYLLLRQKGLLLCIRPKVKF